MKKIFLSLAFIFLFIGIASAIDSEYTFKQNTQVDLKRPCINNGTWCSGSSACNITITNPDSTILVNNVLMTNKGSYHNITLQPNKVLQIGYYKADMVCTDGTLSGSDTFSYQVSPSGNTNVLGLFIIVIVIIYAIGFIGFFGKNVWVSVLGGLAMIALGLYTLNSGIDVFRTTITEIFSWITIGIGAIFALTAGIELIQDSM